MIIKERLIHYAYLMRWDKPIGILLLLWPTLWALWLASAGKPEIHIFFIFIAGVVLMRSAGCVLNDLADRSFDGHVKRTRLRPLVTGHVTSKEAWLLAGILALIAFFLVLFCNRLTIILALIAACFALIYPLLKRVTYLPQFGLGIAFSLGVPMAFAAVTGSVGARGWFVFLTAVLWPVIYDTMYAMVDKEDDIKIGVKSTAILFASMDLLLIGLFQMLFIVMLIILGWMFLLKPIYYASILWVCALFIYQQWLLKNRGPTHCFRAFLNNNWVGLIIFTGIFLSS